MPYPRPSRTLLAFLCVGSLVGLLTIDLGRLLEQPPSTGAQVIECGPFPMELQRQSSSQFRFIAPADQAVHLDVDFLELNGDVMSTRPVALSAGASTAFSMPTRQVGSAIQVIASAPVQVEVTLAYDDIAGVTERKIAPCQPIQQLARGRLAPAVALPGR
jgi:hypothetical protein